MQTTNFIAASAEVTTITSLKKGDVYKRLEESSYGEDKIVHGVVLDVLYNGTDAAIQTMEFKGTYRSLDTSFKTFSGDKEIKIFPSNPEEVKSYLETTVKSIENDIDSKKKELSEAEDKLAKAQELATGGFFKKLQAPEYNKGKVDNLVLQPSKPAVDDSPIDVSDIPF